MTSSVFKIFDFKKVSEEFYLRIISGGCSFCVKLLLHQEIVRIFNQNWNGMENENRFLHEIWSQFGLNLQIFWIFFFSRIVGWYFDRLTERTGKASK